ncbi:MAG: hypothetical protein MAG458_01426 [Nitrosopumilus sp.]|nr:hypothetical protein [Nitrosopumilus sp.]
MTDLKKIIFEFVSNRSIQNESTTSRHVHRRFDISIDEAENILKEMLTNNMVEKFYDEEYQENRYIKK